MLIFLKSKSLSTGTNTNYAISRRRSSITRCEQYKSSKTQHVSKKWDGPARSAKILTCPFVWHQNIRSTLFGFATKHACDKQTDGRTDRQNYDSQDRPRICSRGKNQLAVGEVIDENVDIHSQFELKVMYTF